MLYVEPYRMDLYARIMWSVLALAAQWTVSNHCNFSPAREGKGPLCQRQLGYKH